MIIPIATKLLNRIGLIFLIGIEFLVSFIAFYLTVSLVFMSLAVGEESKNKEITVYMKSDGIHTDFVLPVKNELKNWENTFHFENAKNVDSTSKFISIGWGDQGFFLNTPQWADLTFSTAFNACFYLGKSAIHTNYLKELDFHYKHVKFQISKKEYHLLCNYIEKSLKYSKNKYPICIKGRGYWETDAFYESNGSYGLFNTCNSWINSGLKTAGLKACLWSPLNSGIFHKYQ